MPSPLALGLCCLDHLAKRERGAWTPAKEISAACGLTGGYHLKVLRALVRAGFVELREGAEYRLRRNPDSITVWELLESFIQDFPAAPAESRVPAHLYKALRKKVDLWLIGFTLQDIIDKRQLSAK